MDKILEFLDFSSIDPQMYWRLHATASAKTYEINWRRDATIPWRFRECGALFWTLSRTNEIEARLYAIGIARADFEDAVKTSLLHQVCFADRIVKDSRRLLGNELVDAGIIDHEEFLKNIERVVETMKPVLAPAPSHLRVVKD
jgi:hypothetical protein